MVLMSIASLSIVANCERNPSVSGDGHTLNELLALKGKEGVDSFIL